MAADHVVKGPTAKLEPVVRPGIEAPMDSMPDRISKHVGARLFATGFEEGVQIGGDPSSPLSSDSVRYLNGSDIAGSSFPLTLWSAPPALSSRVNTDVGRHTPMEVSEYARSVIKTVARRDGTETRALSLHSKAQSPRTSAQQIAVESTGLTAEPVVFQRMWIKFDVDTLARARQVGSERFYQMFWEVKAQPDMWLRLKLHYDEAHGLFWVAKASGLKGEQSYWQADTKAVPVVLAAQTSPNGWHKVEIWLDRPGGRFKVAIDGQTLVDRGGALMGPSGNRIDDYRMMMVSSTVAPLAEILFDDLEFWDLPPSDAWAR